jgi:tight adherence protein B
MPVDAVQGTALYDAVVSGAHALSREAFPGRVLIVLTDGANTSKGTTLEQAIKAAHDAGAIVYPIGIESADFSPNALKKLASATGGTYYAAASSSALRDIYSSISREFQRTWRLTYVTKALRGDTLHLQLSVPGASPATADYKIPGSSRAGSGSRSAVPSVLYDHGIGNLLVALLVGLCALGAVAFVAAVPSGLRLKRRLDPHVAPTTVAKGKSAPRERFAAAHGVMNSTEKALGHLDLWKKLHRLIERADLPLRTVELVYMAGGAGLFLGLLCAVAGMSSLVILVAMLIGLAAPIGFVWFKARRRLMTIETQLPDLLITIAASLKAGHSFRQGLQAVVDEGQGPAAKEFKRVLTETRLGRPMDDALNEMAERLDSKNLSFVITAVTIQRQVGGSLAGIFDMVAEAVRQRQQFARKIRSLTAMGRMSAYTLVGLPFFIAAAITAINADYMDPLYHSSTGHFLIGLGLAMMTVGSLMLKKIVSFKG